MIQELGKNTRFAKGKKVGSRLAGRRLILWMFARDGLSPLSTGVGRRHHCAGPFRATVMSVGLSRMFGLRRVTIALDGWVRTVREADIPYLRSG